MATTQLVIDADIVIDQLRQHSTTLESVLERFDVALTAIGLYELTAVPSLPDRQRAALTRLLSLMEILPFDQIAAERAAEVWRMHAGRGQLIGVADILSAGTCLASDVPFLTRNIDHFGRVDGLKLIAPDDIQGGTME